MASTSLEKQLEELNLLQCSLMPGESLEFVPSQPEDTSWHDLLAAFAATGTAKQPHILPPYPARLQARVENVGLWFEIELPREYPSAVHDGVTVTKIIPHVLVRGHTISRSEHEKWQSIVKERLGQVEDSECVQCIPTLVPLDLPRNAAVTRFTS